MPPDDVCSRARIERDERYDGRFYFAVRTTGIFCRPVCPARTALERNVEYFASAPAALGAGYRPCLRCRPEFGPGNPGGSEDLTLVLERIENGALDEDGSVKQLAASVGLGERRLRRLFERELGTSPVRVAQARRLLLARQLLETSDGPVIDVAFASGFASLRRFNEAFHRVFGVTPSEFRRESSARPSAAGDSAGRCAARGGALVLRLGVRTPYDADFVMSYLRARTIGGVERVVQGEVDDAQERVGHAESIYERTFSCGGAGGLLRVAFEPTQGSVGRARLHDRAGAGATLRIGLSFIRRSERLPNLVDLVGRVRRLFGIENDPSGLQVFEHDPVLAPLARRFPGTRVPGAFDPFEVGVRVILGQQVTVAGASTLATRLVGRWGRKLQETGGQEAGCGPSHDPTGESPSMLFPAPEALASAELETIGLTRMRAQTIREFAGLIADRPGLFDRVEEPDRLRRDLLALPGVGDWTATLIVVRALRWRDGFPAGDLVLRKNYAKAAGVAVPTERELRALAQSWRPRRALAAALLWRVR